MTTRAAWAARWEIFGRPTLGRYVIASGASFIAGDFLTKNGSDELGEVTGTDPTDLFALASEGSSDSIEDGFVMAYELDADHWIGMMGNRDPLVGDVDTEYGIVRNSSGHWLVDLTDTSNVRVIVKAVDLLQKYYYVSVLDVHIQS